MYEPDTEKVEPGSEDGGGLRYNDPFLVPTPVLLGRRERANKHPQATASLLQRAAEETLVYRHHSRLPCQLPGLPKSTFLMVFSPDGSKVASTHGDHNIYVSDVKTGQCICTLEGHPRTPWCVAFHPSSNQIIASGCLGGEVRVWDLKGGSEYWTTERNHVIASLAFHPTDQVLVIATCNEIHFWDWSQPKPFAKISTANEKEKVRYVKFDPLGHKLITGIANTLSERPSSSGLGSSVSSGSTNSNIYPSRSQLVEREQQLSQRYNQLSSQYMNLMSRYEALTSRALNTVSRAASRIDRGTDPMEPLPPTPGQESRLQLARQYVRRVNDTERDRQEGGESSSRSGGSGSGGGSGVGDSWNDSLTSDGFASSSSLGMEYDYGLSAVRTLRQIISDDSASESSSLDSSSSATSATSGVSERNARLSLLWSSRLHRLGQQDSDSAGEASGGGAANQPLDGAASVGPNNNTSQHTTRRTTSIPSTEPNSIAANSNTYTNSNSSFSNINNNNSVSFNGSRNSSSNLASNERNNDSISPVSHPTSSRSPLEGGEVGSSRPRGSGGSLWGYFSSRGPIIRRSSIRSETNSTASRDPSNSTSTDTNRESLNGGASGASPTLAAPAPSMDGFHVRYIPIFSLVRRTGARNSPSTPSRTSVRSSIGSPGSLGGASRSPSERTFGRSVTGTSERLSGRIPGRLTVGSRGRYWSRVGRWLDRRNSRTNRSPIAASRIPEVENGREQNPEDILGDSLDSALDAAHNALEDTREVAEAVASSSTGQNNNNDIVEEMTEIFLRRRIPTTSVGENSADTTNVGEAQSDIPSNGENITSPVSDAERANDDHLAVPGPSGISTSNSSSSRNRNSNNSNNLSGAARYRASTSSLLSSSSLDPQFGVQLLSRHIENMERICRAHLEISRHRHEILRLQQIRSMLYDIQHQIHSLRLSVDQSMDDQNGDDHDGSPAGAANAAEAALNNLHGGSEQQHTNSRLGLDESLNVGTERPPAAPCHWSRTSPRSVARLQRGPFGTRIRSRHSTRPSWVSPSLFRRLHGRRSRTRLQLSSPLRGSGSLSSNTGSSGLGLGSSPLPNDSTNPAVTDETATPGTLGPPDQQLLRTSFRRLQERLVARQAELEMQERRLRGYLSNSTTTTTTTAGSSVLSNSTSGTRTSTSSNSSTTLTSSTTTTTTSSSSSSSSNSSSSNNNNSNNNNNNNNNMAPGALGLDADDGYITPPDSQSPPERYRRAGPPTTSLASRIANMIAHQSQFRTQNQSQGDQQENERSPTSLLGSPTLGSPRGSSGIGPLRSSSPASALSRLSSRPRLPRHRWSASEHSSWSDSGLSSHSSLRRAGDSLRSNSNFGRHTTTGRRETSSRAGPPGPPPTAPPPIHWEEDEDGINSDFNNNSSQWYSARRRLRQEIINARRNMSVGRLPGGAGSRFHTLASLRARNAADRQAAREVMRRHRRDRYRQILQRMAERLNSLVNAEQHNQQMLSVSSPSGSADATSEQGDQAANLRLLVRLALHLIYQLLNFICNQNISYEERPISRLPNPFREEELGSGDVDLPPPPPGLGDLEPGLHNLTTLLETVRMASEELRNDNNDNDQQTQSRRRAVTNVPRRLTDFLRRSGGLSAASAGRAVDRSGRSHNPSDSNSTSPRPQLVIPRITLSDPNGSEGQVEEENAAAAAAVAAAAAATAAASASSSAVAAAAAAVAGPSSLDPLELGRRSVGGVPLRLLGRQYAVDRRSPDSEESPGPPDLAEDRGGGDPPFPWRGGSLYGPGGPEVFRPNLRPAHPDRAQEREDNYFSRPYFAPYFGASRTTVGGSLSFVVTQRIQAWDFSNFKIPDISDSTANIVVAKCRIHNDASVDISADGTMLAALVPESQSMTMVGVYSLEKQTLGQLLYSYIFANSTICVSLSPMARHLLVGFASHNPRPTHYHNQKQVIAQIYKLCDGGQNSSGRGHQPGQLQFLRDIEVNCDHRHTSLNCIRWLPYAGQGLIYGTNRGQLNILR